MLSKNDKAENMAVAVEEKTSTEGAYSIYDSNEWDNEVIHQAIQEHQYHLTDRQKRYVGIKRVIDTCIAAVVLLILAIPFLLVAILQKINSPTESVFFLQDRVGLHGKVFKIIKFRTMKSSAPHNTATADLENAEMYLSRFGKALRRFSIDELPQLFNVLCGQMSLIGPRPLIVSEYPAQYLREFYGVYEVRPGITGLAQVNGRDTLNDVDKVNYDRAYTRNICARLDIMILLKSVGYVAKQEGIVEGKQPKVPGFASEVNANVEKDIKDALMNG